MKKFLTALVIAMLSLACFTFGCNSPSAKSSLSFAEESATVLVFEQLRLDVLEENIQSNLVFTTSNESVATVDETGLVTGISEGSCKITVKGDKLSDTIAVSVQPYDEDKISIVKFEELNVFEGKTKTIGVGLAYDGNKVDLGKVTYSIPSEYQQYATVNSNTGLLRGVSKTSNSIPVNVTIKIGSQTFAQFPINVNVYEEAVLELSSTNETIYVTDTCGGKTFDTSFQIQATATLNGAEQETAQFEYTVADTTLVSVSDTGLVTVNPNKLTGVTSVTVKYETAKNTIVEKVISVIVEKPSRTVEFDAGEYIKDDNGEYVLDLSEYNLAEENIKSIRLDGALLTNWSLDGASLKMADAQFENSYDAEKKVFTYNHSFELIAETADENIVINQTVSVVDFAIGSVAELDAFIKAVRDVHYKTKAVGFHAILTANIDYKNGVLTTERSDNDPQGRTKGEFGYFTGVFDGRGYAIANIAIKDSANAIFWGLNTAVIKNVAFVNAVKSCDAAGAILAWNHVAATPAEFSNVYVQGKLTTANGTQAGLFNDSTKYAALSNVIVDIEFTTAKTFNAISRNSSSYNGSNVYAISTTAKELDSYNKGDSSNKLFDSVAGLKNLAEANKKSFTDFKIGENSIWEVNENGVIVYKNAVQYLTKLEQINIDTADFIADTETGEFGTSDFYVASPKTAYQLRTQLSTAVFSVKEGTTLPEGVSLVDGILTVGEDVPVGSEIYIQADAISPFHGKPLTDSIKIIVSSSTKIEGDGVQFVAKNKAGAENSEYTATITIPLASELNITNPTVLNASYNSNAVDGDITFDGTKFIIDGSTLDSVDAELKLNIKTGNGYYTIFAGLEVVDYAIETKEDFKKYIEDIYGKKINESTIAKLVANVDYGGEYLPYSKDSSAPLTGLLDGDGHYISNLKVSRYSIFNVVTNALVKDIAFINIVKGYDTTADNDQSVGTVMTNGGLFASGVSKNVDLKNVYVQGYVEEDKEETYWHHFGLFEQVSSTKEVRLENVIVSVEIEGEKYHGNVMCNYYKNVPPTYKNAFGISNTAASMSGYNPSPTVITKYEIRENMYGSLREATYNMSEAVRKEFTDTGVWEYDEETKTIYFKGTKGLEVEKMLPANVEIDVDLTDFTKSGNDYIAVGGAYLLRANNFRDAVFTLESAVNGVAIENNILTIGSTAVLGSEVVINIKAYSATTNKEYDKQFSIYVGDVITGLTFAKNKTENATIDLTKYEATQEVVVKYLGAVIESTVTDGILTFSLGAIPSSIVLNGLKADTYASVGTTDLNITIGTKTVIVKLNVIDYLIETEADFKAWVTDVKATNGSTGTGATAGFNTSTMRAKKSYYVVLANNITLTEEFVIESKTGVLEGVFDGNGYSISGLTLKNKANIGLFGHVGAFTIKNVSFNEIKSVVHSKLSQSGLIFGEKVYCQLIVENCYFKQVSELTSNKKLGFVNSQNNGAKIIVKDTVIEIVASDSVSETDKVTFIPGTATLNNVLFVANREVTITGDDASSNYRFYNSYKALATGVCNNEVNVDVFDVYANWNTSYNYPVWVNKQV